MKHVLFFILLVFVSVYGFSQDDYAITLQGDTITGKASIAAGKTSVQMITLKNGKEKQRFKVYEIRLLQKKEKIYHSIKVLNKYQLGLLVKEGYLSMYKVMDVETTSSSDFSTPVLLKKDGTYLFVPNIGFKKYIGKFLEDCDHIRKGFENDAYKKSDLNKIIDDYNGCITENTKRGDMHNLEANKNPKKVEQTKALIKTIKAEDSLSDIDGALEMLEDLKIKLNEGHSIPTYLKSALQESLKSNAEYVESLAEILGNY